MDIMTLTSGIGRLALISIFGIKMTSGEILSWSHCELRIADADRSTGIFGVYIQNIHTYKVLVWAEIERLKEQAETTTYTHTQKEATNEITRKKINKNKKKRMIVITLSRKKSLFPFHPSSFYSSTLIKKLERPESSRLRCHSIRRPRRSLGQHQPRSA